MSVSGELRFGLIRRTGCVCQYLFYTFSFILNERGHYFVILVYFSISFGSGIISFVLAA